MNDNSLKAGFQMVDDLKDRVSELMKVEAEKDRLRSEIDRRIKELMEMRKQLGRLRKPKVKK